MTAQVKDGSRPNTAVITTVDRVPARRTGLRPTLSLRLPARKALKICPTE